MEVLCITATKGRHKHLEKLVRCFLNQNYKGKHTLLIYNNGPDRQTLSKEMVDNLPNNKKIKLVNNHLSIKDRKPYSTLGQVYNDILEHVELFIETGDINPDIVTHMDDDDIYLPEHIEEGVKGYQKGGKLAYKPSKSYFVDRVGTHIASNVMEPSIFVNYKFLKEHGYHLENKSAHLKWLDALSRADKYFIDDKGKPTFIYDWSSAIPVTKISGVADNKSKLQEQTSRAADVGDNVITPISNEALEEYLNKINFY